MTRQELLKEINLLPLDERRLLALEILVGKTLTSNSAQLRAIDLTPGMRAEQLIGIARPSGATLTDDDLKDVVTEYLIGEFVVS
ncbi:MAG: hypothetical protein HY774_09225 [Acidobacteria bacterium]|nr:hypothetical protein [Acidobacteriota bacterium]